MTKLTKAQNAAYCPSRIRLSIRQARDKSPVPFSERPERPSRNVSLGNVGNAASRIENDSKGKSANPRPDSAMTNEVKKLDKLSEIHTKIQQAQVVMFFCLFDITD